MKRHPYTCNIVLAGLLAYGIFTAHAATNLLLPASQQAPGGAPIDAQTQGVDGLNYAPATIWERETLLGDMGDYRNQLLFKGISITPTYIAEVMGNVAGGIKPGAATDGLFNIAMDLDLERITGFWKDATFHTNFMWLYGNGISQNYVGDFSNTSNIQGFSTFRVQEMWLQQGLWNHRANVKVGLVAADAEFFTSTYSALFINGTFGAFTLVGSNLPNAPIYPMAAPAVRLFVQPVSKFYAQVGAFYGNSGAQNVNTTGFTFYPNSSAGALIFSEIGFLLNQSPGDRGLHTTLKLGNFVHTANFSTLHSQALNSVNGSDLSGAGANYGFYGVVDHEVYKAAGKTIGFFMRGGFAPSNVSFVSGYIDTGFNFIGFVPGRDSDIVGLAFSRSFISSDYSHSSQFAGGPAAYAENVLEATYKMNVTPWWSLQPDLQFIVNPGGNVGSPSALVLGLRTTVSF
ncbi:MAG: carbohydrate porin [Chthoniobacterales bacterium]